MKMQKYINKYNKNGSVIKCDSIIKYDQLHRQRYKPHCLMHKKGRMFDSDRGTHCFFDTSSTYLLNGQMTVPIIERHIYGVNKKIQDINKCSRNYHVSINFGVK